MLLGEIPCFRRAGSSPVCVAPFSARLLSQAAVRDACGAASRAEFLLSHPKPHSVLVAPRAPADGLGGPDITTQAPRTPSPSVGPAGHSPVPAGDSSGLDCGTCRPVPAGCSSPQGVLPPRASPGPPRTPQDTVPLLGAVPPAVPACGAEAAGSGPWQDAVFSSSREREAVASLLSDQETRLSCPRLLRQPAELPLGGGTRGPAARGAPPAVGRSPAVPPSVVRVQAAAWFCLLLV